MRTLNQSGIPQKSRQRCSSDCIHRLRNPHTAREPWAPRCCIGQCSTCKCRRLYPSPNYCCCRQPPRLERLPLSHRPPSCRQRYSPRSPPSPARAPRTPARTAGHNSPPIREVCSSQTLTTGFRFPGPEARRAPPPVRTPPAVRRSPLR